MADLSVTGEVVVTSEKAEAAFDRVGDKATQMANEVASSAGKAGQAVDGIGAGAEKSADKFTRAESRMRDAIKRSTQELQLLGKTASEKLEFNINAKGLDASKFAPYIEELKKAEAAQKIATGSLDKMGVSAAQTAAALRGVPAQFTDIITSLQGGQAPLTVFLQQGGQLKDMFGGAGAAARALGGYVVGLINPFTLAAAGAAALAVAYNQGSKEADAYRLAMVGTGNAAGTTAGQLKSYAQEISGVVGTQGKAAESLAAFVSTGRVSRDVLKEASQAAIAWERAAGQAVGATAKQFADLGKDPLQAVLKLNEGTNFLTESVYRQIKSLDEQGRTAEAAAVAQRAYADALTGRSGEIERNLGSIETAWNKVKDAAKGGWDAILNVGRAETNQDRLAATRKQIADLENRLAAGSGFSVTAGGAATGRPDAANNARLQAQLLGLQAQAAALEGVAFAAKTAAEAEAERAKQMQATAAWDKEGAKYLTDKAKLERDLTAARNEGLAAGKSQAEIEKRLAQIRESYAKKGGSGGLAAENRELRDQQRIFADLAGVSSTYYAELANYQKQRASGVATEEQYVVLVEQLIQKQPFAVALEKDRAEAIKESAKAAAESSKALSAWYEVREKESQGLQNQINARREEVSMMGMTTEAVVAYTQAKYEQQAAEKEAYAAALESASFYAGEYAEAYKTAAEAARQQAAQLRELGGLEVEKANKDAAKKAAQEWERAAADIERALTDGLMRGFESGKGFAENLIASLKNMFSTLVLRPVISAVMSPVAGAVNGMLYGNAAAAAGGGANALGMLGSGANLINGLQGTQGVLGTVGGWLGLNTAAANAGLAATIGIDAASAAAAANGAAAAGSSGLMGTIGSAMPWIAGAAALYSIIGSLDDSGTYHTGGAAQYSGARGLMSGQDATGYGIGFGRVEKGQDTIDTVSRLAQGLAQSLDGVATSFGRTAGFEIATAFADDTSEDGAWGALRISRDGQELLNWETDRQSKWAPREFADGQEGYQQYLNAIAKDTRQVLMDMDLSSWADKLLNDLGETPTMEELTGVIAQINALQSTFDDLGKTLTGFAAYSDEAKYALVELSGGLDAFRANAQAYYQNFYSPEEQRANLERQLQSQFDKLNITMPDFRADDARAQFRALMEAQDSTTEEGRKVIAMLFELSGAFSQLATVGDTIAATRASLQDRLDALQGNDRAILDRQRKAEYEALMKLDPALAALVSQIYELEDAARAAADAEAARVAAIDKAYTNLEAAYRREEKVLQARLDGLAQYRKTIEQQYALRQESLSLITGVFDVLRSSVQDLYASVESSAAMQAEQGREFIAQALTAALTTGYLPEQDQLSEAIRAARAGVDSGVYANTSEQDFAKLVLAGQLRALEQVAGKQKTDAEMQLEALQSQLDAIDEQTDAINRQIKLQQDALDYFREQIDIANGVYDATLSIEDALRAMADALGLETANTKPLPVNGGGSGGGKPVFGGGGSGGGAAQDPAKYYRLVYGGTAGVGREAIRDESVIARLDALYPIYHSFDGTGDLPGLAAAMKAAGGTIADLSILSGFYESDWRNAFAGVGIPAFAVGTNYVPRDMLAQIHEGEAIVPKAYNPWANGGASSSDNTALIAEIRSLREEVAGLRAAAEETAGATGATADVLVRVTQNGNGMVTAAAPI